MDDQIDRTRQAEAVLISLTAVTSHTNRIAETLLMEGADTSIQAQNPLVVKAVGGAMEVDGAEVVDIRIDLPDLTFHRCRNRAAV